MFEKKSSHGYKPATDKIEIKTLVHGQNSLMSEFRLQKNAVLPRHSHPHEQTGYLISGLMELTIGTKNHRVEPGDSWCIKGELEHSGYAFEDSAAVEVFTPLREEYLP